MTGNRPKARIETVYLDPWGEFFTQVVIYYMVNPSGEYSSPWSDQLHGSEHYFVIRNENGEAIMQCS